MAAAVAAHIAEQQAMPQRNGPSLYAANLSGEGRLGEERAGKGRLGSNPPTPPASHPVALLPCASTTRLACPRTPRCPAALPAAAVDIRGNVMHTADLAGKVTVMVNVASQCGYTGGWMGWGLWLAGWLAGCLAAWLPGCLAAWLAGLPPG